MFGGTLLFHLRIRDLCYMFMVPDVGFKNKFVVFLITAVSQLIGFAAVLSLCYAFVAVADYKDKDYLSYIILFSVISGFFIFYQGSKKRECEKVEK